MATREFKDKTAREWTVWAVYPTPTDARRRAALHPLFAAGWLTCETEGEKRRIAPIPPDWETLPDAELEALCARGQLVRRIERARWGREDADPRYP